MHNFDEDDFEEDRMKEIQNRSMADEIVRNAYRKERTIYLYGKINDSVEIVFTRMLEKLTPKDRKEKLPVIIKMSSVGGDAFCGFSLVCSIESAKARGYEIIIYAYSKIMSAAVPIFLSGSKRYIQRFSKFIIHNPSTFMLGFVSGEQVNRTSREMKELLKIYKSFIIEKTNLSEVVLDVAFDRDDEYSMFGEEALKNGFAEGLF